MGEGLKLEMKFNSEKGLFHIRYSKTTLGKTYNSDHLTPYLNIDLMAQFEQSAIFHFDNIEIGKEF